ncbi:MAG: hypothetical protein MUE81_17155 [Thermoflexibacter sp.]|jgi:hypothetical protein|nr:hypothetical protein [Thermoflexibacter sp.]
MSSYCEKIKDFLGGDEIYYNDKETAVKENGKTFTIDKINHKEKTHCKVKLDKGVVPMRPNRKQCDYLFKIEEEIFLFVELKGSGENATDGFYQIEDTIYFFKEKAIPLHKEKIYGFIIGGKYTKKMNELKEKFRKELGISLVHTTSDKYEYKVTS